MVKQLLIIVFFLFSLPSIAQEKSETIELIDKKISESRNLATENPTEAIKILKGLKKKSEEIGYKEGFLKSSITLTLLYYNNGDYKKVIEESIITEKQARDLQHIENISDSYRMRGIAYGEMNFVKECLNELGKALDMAKQIESPVLRPYKSALIYESYANSYSKLGDFKKEIEYRFKSIGATNTIPEPNEATKNAKYQNLALQYASIGLAYGDLKENDSAIYYSEKALEIHENKEYNIYINGRAVLLNDMAKFHYANKNYGKAISLAKEAEVFERQTTMPYIRRDVYETLFNSYIEKGKNDSSKYYLKLYTALNDSLLAVEKKSIYTPVNKIISDKETEKVNTVKTTLIAAGLISIFFVLGGWLFWRRKNARLQKDYEKLINKLEESEKAAIEERPIAASASIETSSEIDSTKERHYNITGSTLNMILAKLEKFENTDKYIKNEVNLTYLANYLGTNTKYLSEIIKQHKGKSFNNYINGLRIDYIVKLLYKDPKLREYKISYLGELCGFSSREVFTVIFKKETGISPSFFLDKLKKAA